jgi:nucleoside-diphosphate-sugar epimerase
MAEKHHDFSFTEFVVGCIAYEPQPNFFHIDVKNYSAKVLGDPDQKFMLTFLDDLPDLVVEALKNRSQSRNARLSLCSVYVSFNEILSLAEEITNQSFKRTTIDTQELQANIPGSHKKYTQYLMMSIGGYQPAPLESHECNRIQRKDTDDEFFPQVKRTSLQEWLRACTKCAKQQ